MLFSLRNNHLSRILVVSRWHVKIARQLQFSLADPRAKLRPWRALHPTERMGLHLISLPYQT